MNLLRDVRYGLRILTRYPSYAVAALGVVALGIGASAAVFTVVRGVLLTPLPYPKPNRLVLFRADLAGYARQPLLTTDELFALRERTDLFEAVSVVNLSEGNLTSPDDMEAVPAVSIADNFLETLGVRLLHGRTVLHRDISNGRVNAVNISYELWQRRWHGEPGIVGRQIEINNLTMTVVGILPRGFRLHLGSDVNLPTAVDLWYPRVAGYDNDPARAHVVFARLRDAVSLSAAQAEVDTTIKALVASRSARYPTGSVRLSMSTIDQDVTSDIRPALFALSVAVTFLLVAACANLTNLLLARASSRSRELAVRTAIGASRAQIVRQLMAEGLVVGGLGAVAGLLLARWGVDLLLMLAPATLPRRETIGLDAIIAGLAVLVSLFCAVVVSLVPAWHATKSEAAGILKEDPASSRRAGVTRGLLVASQLALSLVLLVGAGLMTRAFVSIRSVPLGFDPDRRLTMNVRLHMSRFNTGTLEEGRARRLAFYHQLAESTRAVPGVEQVGIGWPVPLHDGPIPRRISVGPGQPELPVAGAIALAGYLESLRVPLRAGRYFTVADDNQPVVIIDQRLTEELWPGQSPIGKRLRVSSAVQTLWTEVVGVVGHVQMEGLRAAGLPQIWMTYATSSYSALNIVVRGSNVKALVDPVEQAVQRLGAGRPVRDVRLLDDYVADASADTRFALFVLGVFAVLAVVLTAIGVYGVVEYATSRRTREIAVRLALGADARRIVALVVREGAVWTVLGITAGALMARALTRYLESLLFRVTATDATTFVAVGLLLGVIALVATAIPAIRAVRIDPMLALRSE
jgi:putative ABC transport system permease protein